MNVRRLRKRAVVRSRASIPKEGNSSTTNHGPFNRRYDMYRPAASPFCQREGAVVLPFSSQLVPSFQMRKARQTTTMKMMAR
jgi:hypothetical protein